MIDTSMSYTNQPQGGNKSKTWVIILILVVIAALVGGYFILNQSKKTEETKKVVEETKEPTSTPTPTKKPIDKEKVLIQVQNGTGTPGQAKIAVDALIKAGYKEENIKTANAEDYDHTKTTISAKEGFGDAAEDIKIALTSDFDSIDIDSKVLAEDSEFDIVVITGGKIFEEPTSAPTAKPTASSTSPTPTTTSTTATPTLTLTPTP